MLTMERLEEVTSLSEITVYEVLPGFDSYVADMEVNLKMDPETWAQYRENPVPFVTDLLLDFGEFDPKIDGDHAQDVVDEVVTTWAGPIAFSDPEHMALLAGRTGK